MPPQNESVWFRIGYLVERARTASNGEQLGKLVSRVTALSVPKVSWPVPRGAPDGPERGSAADAGDRDTVSRTIGAVGAGAIALKLLDLIPSAGRPGFRALARAGAAGAIAGLLVRALILVRQPPEASASDGWDLGLLDAGVAGIGRGLLYSQVIEPRLAGPPLLRGLSYGMAESVLGPWGGLDELLAPLAPHRRIPLLRAAMGSEGEEPASGLELLLFGSVLALLYDPRP